MSSQNATIAFYAPIKPPDHLIASGDRLIAQNLLAALKLAGYAPQLASRFIAYSKREADEILQQRQQEALKETERLINHYRSHPSDKPHLWLSYHPYCKAPDWIGPKVSQALNIPYVTVEAARTGQGFENGQDRWKNWRMQAQKGIKQADRHLAFKNSDRLYLTDLLGSAHTIKTLVPFIDTTIEPDLPLFKQPKHWRKQSPIITSVGMMRPGKKVENFKRIAEALIPLQALDWNLILIGDGPEKQRIQSYFKAFDTKRLLFTGSLSHDMVLAHMKASDVFFWPGWKEPIGMVYLEAQLMGLPVAALDSMGVPLTVRHQTTGLLADESNQQELSDHLRAFITDPHLRIQMGQNAHDHVVNNHSLTAAARTLKAVLSPLL